MKKNFSKLLAMILAVALLASSTNLLVSFASSNPTVTVGTSEGKSGQTVQVPVVISNNPGIITMYLSLNYDSSRLQLKGVTNGEVFNSAALVIGNDLTAIPFAINFSDDLAPADITSNGTLAILTFEVLEDAPVGDAAISVTYDPNEIYDFNFNLKTFEIENGKISVVKTHNVIFKDWDGTELKTQTVNDGENATAPTDPERTNYFFKGWDKEFENVIADLIVTAQYEPKMMSIAMKSTPSNPIEGLELDLSGTKITVTYADSTTKDVAVTADMISGYNKNSTGNQTLTVTYTEKGITKTTSFGINVAAKSLDSIVITHIPDKIIYIEGQTFDKSGMEITAHYNNGTSGVVNSVDYSVIPDPLTLGTTQVTITYLGKTVNQNVTVNAKTLSSIALQTNPTKTVYKIGETFSAAEGKLTLTYDNGTTEVINLTNAMCSNYNMNPTVFGAQSVTVTYGGKTTSFNITVNDKTLTGISIKTQPSVKTFLEGKPFTVDGEIWLNYDNDTQEALAINAGMCSGYDTGVPGAQTVTITHNGKTTTYQITVTEKSLDHITVTTPPAKTTYVEGKTFDKTGMVVTAYYNNDTSAVVTSYTVPVAALTVGQTSITVTYTEKGVTKTATTPIMVNAKQLVSISVTTQPTKTSYIEGQIFDKTGMVVKANYDNDTSETITAYTVPASALTVGQTSVTVSYQGKEATVAITVHAKSLLSISVTTPPTKTTYIEGQALNTAGGVITLSYDNGTTATEDITTGMVSGYNANTVGQQTLTVTEGGKTTTFTVTVNAKQISGITLKSAPSKTNYIEGQELALAGAVITVHYDNGTSTDMSVTADMISGYNKNLIGSQNITVTYGGKTATFSVTVTAKTLTGITLNTDGARTLFLEGTDIDLNGLKITAAYDNGVLETLNVTADMISGYDKTVVGDQTVTVSYGAFSKTYTVTVVSRMDVNEVNEKIENIDISELTVEDEDDILLLQDAYNALTELEKSGVSPEDKAKLDEAVAKINELVKPALDKWNEDQTIHVSAEKGIVRHDVVLKVVPVDATSDALAKIRANYGANSVFAAYYDISLLDTTGAKVQPGGTLRIKIKLPADYADGKDLVLIFIADDGTITEITSAKFEDGFAVFETDHLSNYAVVKKLAATGDNGDESEGTPDIPQTGDNGNMTLIWIMFFVSLFGLIGLTVPRRKEWFAKR